MNPNMLHIETHGDPSVGIWPLYFSVEFHGLELGELFECYEDARHEFKVDMANLMEEWLDDTVRFCYFDDECPVHGKLGEDGKCQKCRDEQYEEPW